MKKFISGLVALVLVFGTAAALPQGAGLFDTAIEVSALTYGDYEYKALIDGTVEISRYAGEGGEVNIPATIDGKNVTSIGERAFFGCTSLTSVKLPGSVTSIGSRAFYNCKSLTSISFPDSVTSIGSSAFNGTKWLKNKQEEDPLVIVNGILIDGKTCQGDVTIPDSVTSIGTWAF